MMKCSACRRRKAIYVRPYSGETLCKKCFLDSIENKVRVAIGKHGMFEMDDNIAVAVSGGKDSISLLHILTKIENAFPKASLCAITVDEGIKGYRDEAIEIATENCADLGVKHVVVSFKDLYGHTLDEIVYKTQDRNLTPCSYCGVLRRKALNIAAHKVCADKIATAHNLDDEVQTFLLNLIHGDPLRIARSDPASDLEKSMFIPRVKPFCEVLEKEIVLYAYIKGVSFQVIPCPYAGEALRNDIRHILNRLEEKHPSTKYTAYSSMEKVREAMKEITMKTQVKRCEQCGELTTGNICQTCQLLRELETS